MENKSLYDLKAELNNGEQLPLSNFKNKTLLIVNTASKCGFTPQYEGLEALYKEFRDKNFEIIAFPSNQFMNQEPLNDDEIAEFCQLNYGVSFPVAKKVDVNGRKAHPVFKYLKDAAPGMLGSKSVKWNFTKFLVSKDGETVTRYAPSTNPAELKKNIEDDLQEK
jgi:glutathione peroxidase